MSFDWKDTSFSPPPPPRRRLSPWAVAGIGCLTVTIAGVVGIGGCGAVMYQQMKAEMEKPVNQQEILAELGSDLVPPRVQFDVETTRQGRAAMAVVSRWVPAKGKVIAGFRTEDAPVTLQAWYGAKLAEKGFAHERADRGQQEFYRKGDEAVVVQVQKEQGALNRLIVMKLSGVKPRR